MAELTEAGCVGFSQAETAAVHRPSQVLMRAAHQYAHLRRRCGCAGPWLGKASRARRHRPRMGLSGVPAAAETVALHTSCSNAKARTLRLCRLSVSRRRHGPGARPRPKGLPVTTDVSINSLHLDRRRHRLLQRRHALTPPLRQQRDPTRCARRWPTAPSTRWSATTRRSTGTPEPAPSRGRPGATGAGAAALAGAALGRGRQRPVAGADAGPVTHPVAVLGDGAARWVGRPASRAAWPICACSTRRLDGHARRAAQPGQTRRSPATSGLAG